MISWPTIFVGAALTLVATACLVGAITRERRVLIAATAGVAATVGAVTWNAILRSTTSPRFFVDAPVTVLPVSWQDTVTGVFALGVCTVALSLGPQRDHPARTVVPTALVAALAAFAVDVYLY